MAIVALLVLTACGSDREPASGGGSSGDEDATGDTPDGSQDASGEIVVFAAASLTEAFREIGQRFEATNPDASVTFSFAGSNTLATQLVQGAPADAYASANQTQLQRVVDADLAAGQPTNFVTNTLQIVVPQDNPAGVEDLRAFTQEKLTLAICALEVPCGEAAREAFRAAGLTPQADTLEQDVKQVLTKVALGEADAGLVYRTDVASASRPVQGITFPAAPQAVKRYGTLRLQQAENVAGARAFLDFVTGPGGQQVLERYGFKPTTG